MPVLHRYSLVLLFLIGVKTVIIDLNQIGTRVGVEEWYLGLITRLKLQLKLSVDPQDWWQERASLSVADRFTHFLYDVVLAEIEAPIVIFIDEIDSTLKLDFSDDFFAAIRAAYNARAIDPTYNRLSFIFLGVATPADLIKDHRYTPFDIGRGVNLTELGREDARILQRGLEAINPKQGQTVFDRIMYWTNGHPYLTQKLCLAMTKLDHRREWTEQAVDALVDKLFLSEEAQREVNLKFVRDNIIDNKQRDQLLTLYCQVYQGEVVLENVQSEAENQLKLFGLVRAEQGRLQVRNEIYHQVFNLAWIEANLLPQMPIEVRSETDRRPLKLSWGLIALILTLLLLLTLWFSWIWGPEPAPVEVSAQTHVENFQNAGKAEERLTSLAELFDLSGNENRARQLLQELDPEEQRSLFALADPSGVKDQLITVVRGLYTNLENNDQDNALLQAMLQSLRKLADPAADKLATEIEYWLQGRIHYARREYRQAVTAYDNAIRLNNRNPGTYFDRGLAYVALAEPNGALADLKTVLSLDEGWQARVQQALLDDSQLYTALWDEQGTYQPLIALVPTPTDIPTPTNIPSPTVTPTHTPTAIPTNTSTSTPTNTPIPTLTNTPTAIPTNTSTATSTSTPTSTPTLRPPLLPAPTLLEPNNEVIFGNRDAQITLRWSPVKPTLAPDEQYLIVIPYKPKAAVDEIWYDYTCTKQTSWSVADHAWLLDASLDGQFSWSVTLIRLTLANSEDCQVNIQDKAVLEDITISQTSEERIFGWRAAFPSGSSGGGGGESNSGNSSSNSGVPTR